MYMSFVELHNPLFLAGVNHGVKLGQDASVSKIEAIFYEWSTGKLFVFFKDKVGIIPDSNIANMVPIDSSDLVEKYFIVKIPQTKTVKTKTHTSHPMKLNIPSAQVEDPSTKVQNPPMPRTLK